MSSLKIIRINFILPILPDCLKNGYCNIKSGESIGICFCVTTYYFNPQTSSCSPRLSYNDSCTYSYECLEYKRLSCITNLCQCDSNTKFWNSTALECQYLKVPFGLCTSPSLQIECIPNSVCMANLNNMGYNKCVCGIVSSYAWWWFNVNTGVCESTQLAGVQCSSDYECVNFAYCSYTLSSPNKKVCICDTMYYQHPNGQCYVKQGFNTSCSVIDQCNLNQYNH